MAADMLSGWGRSWPLPPRGIKKHHPLKYPPGRWAKPGKGGPYIGKHLFSLQVTRGAHPQREQMIAGCCSGRLVMDGGARAAPRALACSSASPWSHQPSRWRPGTPAWTTLSGPLGCRSRAVWASQRLTTHAPPPPPPPRVPHHSLPWWAVPSLRPGHGGQRVLPGAGAGLQILFQEAARPAA